MPGVRHVVEISRGVAVVADGYWQALKGREALEIDWDEGPLADLDSQSQREQYAELAKQPGAVARKEGDAAAAMNDAAKKIEAVYELPYLAHAPMEPLNCVADVRPDGCEVWTGTQFQTADHNAAVEITGLKPEQVKLHTMLLGGGFGRRGVFDSHFVREAVEVSKIVKKPVKVIWSREDDIRGGYYRPAAYHSVAAGLDEAGDLIAWRHRIVCPVLHGEHAVRRRHGCRRRGPGRRRRGRRSALRDPQYPGGLATGPWRRSHASGGARWDIPTPPLSSKVFSTKWPTRRQKTPMSSAWRCWETSPAQGALELAAVKGRLGRAAGRRTRARIGRA